MNLIAWADVVGYEGFYMVSTFGDIYSVERNAGNQFGKGQIMKPVKTKKGYLQLSLSKNGKRKNFRLNRIVAAAFHPNPLNLPEVNHLDGDKLNNSFINLEWTTRLENQRHAFENGLAKAYFLSGNLHKNIKIREETRVEIKALYEKGELSYNQIGKLYSVNGSAIYKAIKKVK